MKRLFWLVLGFIGAGNLFAQTHFSVSQTEGCGSMQVGFTNNHPSAGYMPQPFVTTGFSYQWNFGNGQTGTQQNPPVQNYSNPGNYTVNYTCHVDTVGFYLTGILVTQVNCNDPLGGKPAPYIIIRDNTSTVVFSTESSYINDQNPPYSWALNLQLNNPPYFIWVWDYDSLDGNDNCVDDTENQPGTSTVLTLPANNATTFGNSTMSYVNGGLTFEAFFYKPVTTYTDSVVLTVHDVPAVPALSIPSASYCLGETLPAIVATGTAGNIINWYSDSQLTQLLHTGAIYSPASGIAGTYNYYVTQTHPVTGCVSTAAVSSIQIAPLSPPVLSVYNATYCTGEVVNGITAQGTMVEWYSDSLLTQLVHSGDTLSLQQASVGSYTYYVTQTDTSRNCVSSPAICNITFIQGIEATVNVTPVSCFGLSDGAAVVSVTNGTPPYTYTWTGGSTTEMLNNVPAGDYLLTIMDASFCLKLMLAIVEQPDELVIDETITHIACYGNASGQVILDVTGGNSGYVYNWSNGASSSVNTGITAGSVSVTVTDSNNCSSSETYTLNQPDEIMADKVIQPESCNGSVDGAIDVTVTGGVSPYAYLWSNQSVFEDLSDIARGTYFLTITDMNNCMKVETISVSSSYDFCLDIPNVITPNGDGKNDKWKIRFIEMYPSCVVKVYNRWGQTLFESTGYTTEFDGTWNGKDVPAGSYFYIIDLKTGSENDVFHGNIDIVR